MLLKTEPSPFHLAVVDEEQCIGCTKCIDACPVDAILGAAKQMHTVIAEHCTGCEDCLPPCPVDCIDMIPLSDQDETRPSTQENESRNSARHARLERNKELKRERKKQLSQKPDKKDLQLKILASIKRSKINKQKHSQQPDR